MQDVTLMNDTASIVAEPEHHDAVRWICDWKIDKFENVPAELHGLSGEDQVRHLVSAGVVPDETIDRHGNLLMYGGASALWQALIGGGTATAGQTLTFFNNANAAIGVGDSTAATVATQTNLQASTNLVRQPVDSTYPQQTDGVVVGSASIVFRATFATGSANWAWNEWGVFNSATPATGRMLNRKVESLGTKTSSASWQMTVTLSLQ